MNFNYLVSKYLGIHNCIVHDRTYAGLEFPPEFSKPGIKTFEAWQQLEDQEMNKRGLVMAERESQMQLKQQHARARALEEIRPYEDKLKELEQTAKEEATKLKKEALECQYLLKSRGHIVEAWIEITSAQDLINKEAQAYLDDTAHVLSWDHTEIPVDIAIKRTEAHKRLKNGEAVYQDWRTLRHSEMPSREELQEAILKGGEHLELIRKTCKEIALRYPAPKVRDNHNHIFRRQE